MFPAIGINTKGISDKHINACDQPIHFVYPKFGERKMSIRGAHKNLKIQGIVNIAVNVVTVSISTPFCLSKVGMAHHIKPIGAPSAK